MPWLKREKRPSKSLCIVGTLISLIATAAAAQYSAPAHEGHAELPGVRIWPEVVIVPSRAGLAVGRPNACCATGVPAHRPYQVESARAPASARR